MLDLKSMLVLTVVWLDDLASLDKPKLFFASLLTLKAGLFHFRNDVRASDDYAFKWNEFVDMLGVKLSDLKVLAEIEWPDLDDLFIFLPVLTVICLMCDVIKVSHWHLLHFVLTYHQGRKFELKIDFGMWNGGLVSPDGTISVVIKIQIFEFLGKIMLSKNILLFYRRKMVEAIFPSWL